MHAHMCAHIRSACGMHVCVYVQCAEQTKEYINTQVIIGIYIYIYMCVHIQIYKHTCVFQACYVMTFGPIDWFGVPTGASAEEASIRLSCLPGH